MKRKKKVYLALALIPTAALLLPMFAAKPARAACAQNANLTWTCTNGAGQTVTGQTITPSTYPNTNVHGISTIIGGTSAGSATLASNDGAEITVSNTTILNNNVYPGANNFSVTGNNTGINLTNAIGGSGNLTLTMAGANSATTARGTGIFVNNRGTGTGTVTISGDLTVVSLWNKSLEGQDGVEVTTTSGKASLDMPGASGRITVMGGGNGILLRSRTFGGNSGGSVTGHIGPNMDIVVNQPPNLACNGPDCGSNGIYAYVDAGNGAVDLTTAAGINATGSSANGILASAINGNVTIHNGYTTTDDVNFIGLPPSPFPGSGGISTKGDESNGILAYANGGNVSVSNDGLIVADGRVSFGIDAYTTTDSAANAGNVTVNNNSGIIKSGILDPLDTNDNSGGIKASSTTTGSGDTGTVTVENTKNAVITTHGTVSDGIQATTFSTGTGKANDVTVISDTDEIDTFGTNANGIFAQAQSTGAGAAGNVTIISTGDKIIAGGTNATAIFAQTQATGTGAAGDVTITSTSDAIYTNGTNATGIYAQTQSAGAKAAGSVSITHTGQSITTIGDKATAIFAQAQATGTGAAGDVTIASTGDTITTQGTSATGLYAESIISGDAVLAGKKSGNVTVADNRSNITTNDTLSGDYNGQAIHAHSTNGDVLVETSGNLMTNSGSSTLQASAGGEGRVTIHQMGTVTSKGTGPDAAAVWAQSADGALTIDNSGNVSTAGAVRSPGFFAQATGSGMVSVTNSGDIATIGLGTGNGGIFAQAANGAVTVDNTGGITTSGAASMGIAATSTTGAISLSNGGIIATTGAGANGIDAATDSGAISISNNAAVASAQADGILATATATSPSFTLANQAAGDIFGATAGVALTGNFTSVAIANAGTIDAANDFAINAATLTTPVNIDNSGTINGYMTLGQAANTLTNAGTWNLRNANAITNGVAMADMGKGASVTNSGTLNLLGNAAGAAPLDATGQYVPLKVDSVVNAQVKNPYNVMTAGGPVQGQILGVATFTNSGVIDMGPASPAGGDVLMISGGHTAGVAGGGVFVANGGKIVMDTVLNEGGANAHSDVLAVDSTRLGTAPTQLSLVTSGAGAFTVGNGIPLVEVLNKAASANGVFTLGGARIVSGEYEYDLYHNGLGVDAQDGNWYLRSIASNPPADDTPTTKDPATSLATPPATSPATPSTTPPITPLATLLATPTAKPSPRPEPTVYVRNMAAANSMFIHTLHDRLGEPQYTETYDGNGKDGKDKDNNVPAVWGRVAGSRTNTEANGGSIDTRTNSGLVHLGGDLARWTDGHSRYHLGVMGAYGKSDTDAWDNDVPYTSSGIRRKASGDVEGYSLGVYGTWYGNDKYPAGPYVDVWGMFNWFDNSVRGNGLPEETYSSHGGIVSIEAGYAFIVRDDGKRQWMLEPQAQVAYAIHNQDSHVETNGTRVNNDDGGGIIARLGVRMYNRGTQGDNGTQPFVEANVWHYSMNNSLDFNGTTVSDGAPGTRYEFKAGFQTELAKDWQMWGHLGGQWGPDGYTRYEGLVGLKYVF